MTAAATSPTSSFVTFWSWRAAANGTLNAFMSIVSHGDSPDIRDDDSGIQPTRSRIKIVRKVVNSLLRSLKDQLVVVAISGICGRTGQSHPSPGQPLLV